MNSRYPAPANRFTAEAVELGRRVAASPVADQDELLVFVHGRYTEISHRACHAVDAVDVDVVWDVEQILDWHAVVRLVPPLAVVDEERAR